MRICIQSGDLPEQFGIGRCYEMIAEAGFEAIDWNLDHALPSVRVKNLEFPGKCIFEKSLDEVMEYYKDELAAIRRSGLAISQAHAVFPSYIPGHPELLEYTVGLHKRTVEFCAAVGCERLVIHNTSLSDADEENTPESIEALNMYQFSSLIPMLKDNNVTVCLETLFTRRGKDFVEGTCSDPHEAVSCIDRLNELAGREAFGLCVDVGHLNLLRKEFRTFMPIVGKRVKALHIHDNGAYDDSHLAPFTGNVNWKHFVQSLRDIGYRGDLDFETFSQTTRAFNFDPELVMPWLQLICSTGKSFRRKITEEER